MMVMARTMNNQPTSQPDYRDKVVNLLKIYDGSRNVHSSESAT